MKTNNGGMDEKDTLLLANRVAERDKITSPRLGDYVLFPTGELERFSHDWDDGMQTSPSGSFYLSAGGYASFSGGLNPVTPIGELKLAPVSLPGSFWFFHHDSPGAGRGVYFNIPCRVYLTSAPYEGYLGQDFQSKELAVLKKELAANGVGSHSPSSLD